MRNMLHPTMLRYVTFRCCDRSAGTGPTVLGYDLPKCCDRLLALVTVDSLILAGEKIDRTKKTLTEVKLGRPLYKFISL